MVNNPKLYKPLAALMVCCGLAFSFWYSNAWLQLCYGLALFLFGMQCIEEGLHNAAGGALQRLMSKSTSTPLKGLLFGVGASFVLQSTTLVSLLTIAFLSTGLITLAGGIAVLLGTNLGATSGIWLLAIAGKSVSLSPVAVPMLVFGILASFFSSKVKSFGRVLVGISLIFIGIDAIKGGFQSVGDTVNFSSMNVGGATEIAIFCLVGLVLTLVLQSSHATLILTLAALAGGQIHVAQGFAIAIGSNVGSSLTTAVVGFLGGESNGRRLALMHLLFNSITAVLSLILWMPLSRSVAWIAGLTDMNPLLQLALFHTLFNGLGVAAFWKWQKRLAKSLCRWLPEKSKNGLLPESSEAVRPMYLHHNMLRSGDTALRAVFQEIGRLSELSLEVICHALYVPAGKLYSYCDDCNELPLPKKPLETNVQSFYEWQIKPLYGDILDFASRIDIDGEEHQQELTAAHLIASQMVAIVKESKNLQKNMQRFLQDGEAAVYYDYLQLREHLLATLCQFNSVLQGRLQGEERERQMDGLGQHIDTVEAIRTRALIKLRNDELDSAQASSLMNDINYTRRIGMGLLEILKTDVHGLLQTDRPQESIESGVQAA